MEQHEREHRRGGRLAVCPGDGDGRAQRGDRREDVGPATQRMADAFAADIANHPADWHMMQKLWLADLDDDRRKAPQGSR